MAIDFPTSPANGDTYPFGGKKWVFNGTGWAIDASAGGATSQYWRGDKSWRDFATDVRGAVLTGLSTATSAPISATDTVLVAQGKLQAQVSGSTTALAGKLSTTGGTLSANAGSVPAPQSDTVLQVVGADGHPARVEIDAFGSFPVFQCRAASGTASAPTPVGDGAPLAGFAGAGWDGSAWTTARGNFNIQADGAWSETNNGTFLRVNLTRSGATSQVVAYDMRTDMFIPGTSNYISNGGPANLWSVVYAATGAINTSDAREKTAVTPLSDVELAAASDLARAIGTYQWLASVAEKGDAARHHAGLTVQRAIAIMEQHGLDPFRYGFICYDEWPEQPDLVDPETSEVTQEYRPAGDRYSFRTDEMLMFIARGAAAERDAQAALIDAQAALIKDLTARLTALEAA